MVDGTKTLGIMLFTSPYGSQDADHVCRIAERALNMGYGVHIFLYGDGVHAQLAGQDPKMFYNVGAALERIGILDDVDKPIEAVNPHRVKGL